MGDEPAAQSMDQRGSQLRLRETENQATELTGTIEAFYIVTTVARESMDGINKKAGQVCGWDKHRCLKLSNGRFEGLLLRGQGPPKAARAPARPRSSAAEAQALDSVEDTLSEIIRRASNSPHRLPSQDSAISPFLELWERHQLPDPNRSSVSIGDILPSSIDRCDLWRLPFLNPIAELLQTALGHPK